MNSKKPKVSVEIKLNGPIIISGNCLVKRADGSEETVERIVLCRCGQSGIMPLCDASHNRVGFNSK